MNHTPGPWRAVCRDIGYAGGEWPEDNFLQWEIDGPRAPSGRGQFYQADALLIAAAPDLLEAMRELVDYAMRHDDDRDMWVQARAAIAKAEGK